MNFNTVLVSHSGRYYRFTRTEGNLKCQVCYWKGVVMPPEEGKPNFQAYVEQKYAPYRQIWAESILKSESEALDWVAQQLSKDTPIEEEE